MFTEVQNDILTALDGITANGTPVFQERGVWQGELEEIMKVVQKLPSTHVALASGLFSPARTSPAVTAPCRMGWDVIVMYQCLTDRKVSATMGYGLIESVVKQLTGLKTQGGQLWPESLDLIATINGKTAYGIRFAIERNMP